jgi:hypothetical protein
MNLETFQRAQLVAFAIQEAGSSGSVNSMKAVCYCMANRVRAGWHGGGWLDAIEAAPETAAHEPLVPSLSYRITALLGLLREVDDVFYASSEDETRKVVGKCLYWQNILRKDIRPWFVENIVRNPEDHPRRAQVGMIVLYE